MLDALMHVLARVLTPMFAVGLLGATVVVAITVVHDVIDFFSDNDPALPDPRKR